MAWRGILAAGLVLMLQVPVFAGTCALCREALRSGGSAGLLEGFYWSIILIVSVPLIVLAVGVRYALKVYRSAR